MQAEEFRALLYDLRIPRSAECMAARLQTATHQGLLGICIVKLVNENSILGPLTLPSAPIRPKCRDGTGLQTVTVHVQQQTCVQMSGLGGYIEDSDEMPVRTAATTDARTVQADVV